jgi:hypothetical protein
MVIPGGKTGIRFARLRFGKAFAPIKLEVVVALGNSRGVVNNPYEKVMIGIDPGIYCFVVVREPTPERPFYLSDRVADLRLGRGPASGPRRAAPIRPNNFSFI